jgi:hypothetical protein
MMEMGAQSCWPVSARTKGDRRLSKFDWQVQLVNVTPSNLNG